MIIFLDFDGVLHLRPTDERGIFCHLPAFENVVREFPSVKLVISSSWREIYPLDVLTEIFSPDIQSRIMGLTPIVRDARCWPRYTEIMQWLLIYSYKGPWIALDDAQNEFPPHYPNLVCCESAAGFSDYSAQQLKNALTALNSI